jgi:ABC-type transporter Mla maintaining outer membrane lipid asymmetry permease subunit MlaE
VLFEAKKLFMSHPLAVLWARSLTPVWLLQGEISDEAFRAYFAQFGELDDCVVTLTVSSLALAVQVVLSCCYDGVLALPHVA